MMKLVDDISGDNGPMLDTDVEYLDNNTTSYEDPLGETPTNNQANHRPTAAGDWSSAIGNSFYSCGLHRFS